MHTILGTGEQLPAPSLRPCAQRGSRQVRASKKMRLSALKMAVMKPTIPRKNQLQPKLESFLLSWKLPKTALEDHC